jgi:hypothetical protein
MYINTVQSLNNINRTLFEFQITHTRYRPCDIVIKKKTKKKQVQHAKNLRKHLSKLSIIGGACLLYV